MPNPASRNILSSDSARCYPFWSVRPIFVAPSPLVSLVVSRPEHHYAVLS